ncbi:MAG: phosphoribosyltransferase [Rhodospirillales bacterium]|nr:phosphoribosyltransferase [Rhodospirillales bacterium]
MAEDFIEPTTGYWQDLHAGTPKGLQDRPPYRLGYPVRLPCGRVLVLPLRTLPDGRQAVASLIANQASHAVVEALAGHMAALARPLAPDLVVGVPTLGLALAGKVAEGLGQDRYVPLGYSRKFWYRDDLSEPVSSITSPTPGKRIFLDPNLLPLVQGRRVVLVDDAISTGSTIVAAAALLARLGVGLAGIVVAMKQTNRWQATLAKADPGLPGKVLGVYGCPLFARAEDGWVPLSDTLPAVP